MGPPKRVVVQKVKIGQNFVLVLAGLGIQAGRCFQVVIVWVRVVVNRGLIFIQGGLTSVSCQLECHIFENCTWKFYNSLPSKRSFGTLTTMTDSSSTFIIGGEENSRKQLTSVDKLIDGQWKAVEPLMEPISRHCAVPLEDREEVFLIGGHIGSDPFSDQCMRYDAKTGESTFLQTKLKRGGQLHSCATIGSNKIVVVGGRDSRGTMKSVEVYDLQRSKWTEPKNLELPLGICYAGITPHPTGKKN